MTWFWIGIAIVAFWAAARHLRRRPFDVEHAGLRITVMPANLSVRLHEDPTPEQLEEIALWVSDWPSVLKERPGIYDL